MGGLNELDMTGASEHSMEPSFVSYLLLPFLTNGTLNIPYQVFFWRFTLLEVSGCQWSHRQRRAGPLALLKPIPGLAMKLVCSLI